MQIPESSRLGRVTESTQAWSIQTGHAPQGATTWDNSHRRRITQKSRSGSRTPKPVDGTRTFRTRLPSGSACAWAGPIWILSTVAWDGMPVCGHPRWGIRLLGEQSFDCLRGTLGLRGRFIFNTWLLVTTPEVAVVDFGRFFAFDREVQCGYFRYSVIYV